MLNVKNFYKNCKNNMLANIQEIWDIFIYSCTFLAGYQLHYFYD